MQKDYGLISSYLNNLNLILHYNEENTFALSTRQLNFSLKTIPRVDWIITGHTLLCNATIAIMFVSSRKSGADLIGKNCIMNYKPNLMTVEND